MFLGHDSDSVKNFFKCRQYLGDLFSQADFQNILTAEDFSINTLLPPLRLLKTADYECRLGGRTEGREYGNMKKMKSKH
jgi:hypothetical protein